MSRTILIVAAAGLLGLLPSCTFVGNVIRTPIRAITDGGDAIDSGTPKPHATGTEVEEIMALATRNYGP